MSKLNATINCEKTKQHCYKDGCFEMHIADDFFCQKHHEERLPKRRAKELRKLYGHQKRVAEMLAKFHALPEPERPNEGFIPGVRR